MKTWKRTEIVSLNTFKIDFDNLIKKTNFSVITFSLNQKLYACSKTHIVLHRHVVFDGAIQAFIKLLRKRKFDQRVTMS